MNTREYIWNLYLFGIEQYLCSREEKKLRIDLCLQEMSIIIIFCIQVTDCQIHTQTVNYISTMNIIYIPIGSPLDFESDFIRS